MTCLSKRIISEQLITGVRMIKINEPVDSAVGMSDEEPVSPADETVQTDPSVISDSLPASNGESLADQQLLEAWNAGYQAGMEEVQEGHVPPEPEFKAGAEDSVDSQNPVAIMQTITESIVTNQQQLVGVTEQTIIALACAVAGKVIRHTVDEDNELVSRVVHDALTHSIASTRLTVRVHPDDLQLIEFHRPDFLAILNGESSLDIVPDSTVSHGGCLIDTESGTIDARLTTQVKEIEQALLNSGK